MNPIVFLVKITLNPLSLLKSSYMTIDKNIYSLDQNEIHPHEKSRSDAEMEWKTV